MKVIIAGSRTLGSINDIVNAVAESGFDITEVVSGCCEGVDWAGECWAMTKNIPVKRFPAHWRTYGRAAGPIRNEEMAQYADALILIWDGKSMGSKSMFSMAKKHGLKIYTNDTGEAL